MTNPTKPEDLRRDQNKHISVEDLKKIRGGMGGGEGGEVGRSARVEKSDEDFPAPAALA